MRWLLLILSFMLLGCETSGLYSDQRNGFIFSRKLQICGTISRAYDTTFDGTWDTSIVTIPEECNLEMEKALENVRDSD